MKENEKIIKEIDKYVNKIKGILNIYDKIIKLNISISYIMYTLHVYSYMENALKESGAINVINTVLVIMIVFSNIKLYKYENKVRTLKRNKIETHDEYQEDDKSFRFNIIAIKIVSILFVFNFVLDIFA